MHYTGADMRMYSVSEAIDPAWERTKLVLRTGRWSTNFKMALVTLLAEIGTLLILPVNFIFRTGRMLPAGANAAAAHAAAGFLLLFALFTTAFYLLAFFFGSRMQLTLVDLILTRTHTVAPLWARHRTSMWRWMGIKLVPSLLLLIALVPFCAAMARVQQAATPTTQAQVDPQAAAQIQLHAMQHAFGSILAISFWYAALTLFAMLLYSQWRDFLMPYLGIDQLPLRTALERWLLLWRTYPAALTGYVFFRIVLLFGVVLAYYIALLFAVMIPVALLVLLGVLIKVAIHGIAGTVLLTIFAVIAGLLVLAWYLLLLLFGLAAYGVFFQCYALYFLGGRDPRIGALLEPEMDIPVWTPPPSLPRDDDDSSSGPDLPADPALA